MAMGIFAPGEDGFISRIGDLHSNIERDIAQKKAKMEHQSSSKWHYIPSFTNSLQFVDVAGRAVLKDAKKLQIVKSNGLGLYRSNVSRSIMAGDGDVKVVSSTINNYLLCKGRVVDIQSSHIGSLTIGSRDGKQEIKIRDTVINKLTLPEGKMTLELNFIKGDLIYTSADKNFSLIFRHVTVENIL